jgi:hypothetical protein
VIPRQAPRLFAILAVGLLSSDLSAQEVSTGVGDVTIGGRLHVQYATSSVGAAVEDILIRRARVRVDIRVSELVDARVQPDFAGGGAALQDAYVRFSFDPGLRVSLGQFKRAFSAFELASSTDLPTIERDGRIEGVGGCPGVGGLCSFSRLTEKLSFDGRDTGLRFDGRLGEGFSYVATISNGEGINTSDVNDGKSFSGRLTYDVGRVTLGGSFAVHDYVVSPEDEVPETEYADALSLDAEIGTWREGFHFLAAWVRGDNWEVGPDASFTALQGLASVYLPLESTRLAGLEPMLRVGWADTDGGADDGGGVLFTPGMTLYVSGKNGLAANIDVFSPSGDGDTEWSFKLMTLFFF